MAQEAAIPDADADLVAAISDDPADTPSVVEAGKKKIGWKGLAALAAAVLLLVGGAAIAIARVVGDKFHVPTRDQKATQATAAAAKAPGAGREFPALPPPRADAPPAPVAAKFPAADGAGGVVMPIAVCADGQPCGKSDASGTGRPAAGPATGAAVRTPPSPEDGLLMVAEVPPGRAPSSGGVASREPASPVVPVELAKSRGAPGAVGTAAVDFGGLEEKRQALENMQKTAAALVDRVRSLQTPVAGGAPAAPAGVAAAAPIGATQIAATGVPAPAGKSDVVYATQLPNISLTIPKGTSFTCSLKTKVVSAVSGPVSCTVLRNVYSTDGKTVLIERGSHVDGEYVVVAVKPGLTRIPAVWTRVRTPNGVVANIESPAVGALGESGIGGYVDNRWFERIGGALLVSFLDDILKVVVANAVPENTTQTSNTLVLSSTGATAEKLPEKVLDSTINIPPILTKNQGDMVGVYVNRDVDFSAVYALRPSEGTR